MVTMSIWKPVKKVTGCRRGNLMASSAVSVVDTDEKKIKLELLWKHFDLSKTARTLKSLRILDQNVTNVERLGYSRQPQLETGPSMNTKEAEKESTMIWCSDEFLLEQRACLENSHIVSDTAEKAADQNTLHARSFAKDSKDNYSSTDNAQFKKMNK